MLKPRFKKIRENDGVVEVDGVKLDAESAEIVFADKDKDIQVVVSNDPENDNIAVVAVLTNSKEEVEDEQVLGSASVETEEGTVEVEGNKEEKCKEARREAFRKRLEARRAARKTDERREAFRKRLEARKAAKQTESKAKAIEEARAKFRSKIKKA